MDVNFRSGTGADVDALLLLIRDFYEFEHLPYDEALLRRLLAQLAADELLGRLVVFESDRKLIGYMALGFGFSLEFHGRDCLIDEFYVRPEYRSRGIGRAAIEFAFNICRELGIDAIHLEADYTNVRGHEFYKQLRFKDHQRHLMTRWL